MSLTNNLEIALPEIPELALGEEEEETPSPEQKDEDEPLGNHLFSLSNILPATANREIDSNFFTGAEDNFSDSLTGEMTGGLAAPAQTMAATETTTLEFRQNQLKLQILEGGALVEGIIGQQNQPVPNLFERLKIELYL